VSDPRTGIIHERMKEIKKIIAVSSGKGGVGKSIVASTLALTLAKKGCKVGLFDLDFTSPSTHVILGVGGIQPKEERGIVPPEKLGMNKRLFEKLTNEMRKKRVIINEEKEKLD